MKSHKNLVFILIIIFSASVLIAKGDQKYQSKKLFKTNCQPDFTMFNINNISTYFKNDGKSDVNPNGSSGFIYPKGSNKAIFFESGFLYGGKVDGEIKVGGSTYNQGQVPGRIISEGVAENPGLPGVRIYRVRRDYKTADLSDEIVIKIDTINNRSSYTQIVSAMEAYTQYEMDWNNWPANYGAPFEDINNNGIYEPAVDIPGVPGADQTIWFVCNDLDEKTVKSLYGSSPIGIEMQTTIWGYKDDDVLSNTLFRKYVLINKSGKNITDMYVSMWSDPDLGDATDDFVGFDSTINLAYVYNGNYYDATYGDQIPSAGFKLMQGPLVDGEINDEGTKNGQIINGKKNLTYTSFNFFIGSDPVFSDPNLGQYNEGTLETYNLMQGKIGTTGQPFVDPNTVMETKLCLAGDPIKNEGWIDGQLHPPGDRRMIASSGPFEMAAGDTQEIIYAEVAALRNNRIESLKLLRYFCSNLNEKKNRIFNVNIDLPDVPVLESSNFAPLKTIKISWNDITHTKQVENIVKDGYQFQGYNIYQFNSEYFIKNNDKIIATFDKADGIKNIYGSIMDTATGWITQGLLQPGFDNGIKREIVLDKDIYTNEPLIKGKTYHFGLSYYLVNPELENNESIIESDLSLLDVKYCYDYPGVNYGNEISVTQAHGLSNADMEILVANPEILKDDKYEITFDSLNNELVWNLMSTANNSYVAENEKLSETKNPYSVRAVPRVYYNVDGLNIFIAQTLGGIFEDGILEVAYGGESIPQIGYDSLGAKWGGNNVWHDPNWEGINKDRDIYYISAGGWAGDLKRLNKYEKYNKGNDYELRFTNKSNNYGVFAFTDDKIASVPFELWNIGYKTPDDTTDDYRMIPLLSENVRTSSNWGWGTGIDVALGYPISDWIYWMDPQDYTPGENGFIKFADACDKSGGAGKTYNLQGDNSEYGYYADFHGGFVYPIGRMVICDYDEDGNPPPPGTTIRLLTARPITTNDVFEFETKQVIIKTIPDELYVSQNYPNPFNPLTKIQFVIPENGNVKLTVYNILGQKVKDLLNRSMEAGKYEVSFNAAGFASGIYVYRLELNNQISEVKKMVLLK